MEAEFGMASPGSSDQAAKEVRHSYANTRTTHWRCVRASRVAWKPEVLRSSARELACACARLRLAAMSCKPCLAEVLICVTGPHTPCASCPPPSLQRLLQPRGKLPRASQCESVCQQSPGWCSITPVRDRTAGGEHCLHVHLAAQAHAALPRAAAEVTASRHAPCRPRRCLSRHCPTSCWAPSCGAPGRTGRRALQRRRCAPRPAWRPCAAACASCCARRRCRWRSTSARRLRATRSAAGCSVPRGPAAWRPPSSASFLMKMRSHFRISCGSGRCLIGFWPGTAARCCSCPECRCSWWPVGGGTWRGLL